MVEMQGNCPHCGSDLEAGAIFCAECGRRVAPEPPRSGANGPASAGAGPADPAKPQSLARTMMGVQASSLFGSRSPGTPPAKAAPPQGAFGPQSQGPNSQLGPAPSSFGGARERAGSPGESARGALPAAVSGNGKSAADEPAPAAEAEDTSPEALDAAGEAASGESASSLDAAVAPDSEEARDPEESSSPAAAAAPPTEPVPSGPPLTAAVGAGAALGGKTLMGMEFGRDSNNVGAQLAAAVAAAKAAGANLATTQGGFGPASVAAAPAPARAPAPPVAAAPVAPAPAAPVAPVAAAPVAPAPAAPTLTPASVPPPSAASGASAFGSMAGSEAEAIAAERPRRPLAKTMLGLSADATALGLQRSEGGSTPAPAAAAPSPVAPAAATPPGRTTANPMARTMLGMANPMAGLPPQAAPKAEPKTIQGVPLAGLGSASAPLPHPNERGGMARTMLGMAPISSGASTPAPGPATPAALGGRTMLGVPASERPQVPPPFESHTPGPAAAPPSESRRTSSVPPKREIKALWPLVAATLLVVIATLVLFVRSPATPQVDVSAKIVSTETGEALLFEVPSAVEGSKIRFGGQEKPLTAGRASFALAADSLRVGDNLVLADIVKPTGETEPFRITLAVFYRIWVDTAALRAERSALDVVVTALPGTRVTLDGEDLKLDDAGRGTRSYPIDVVGEAKGGVIEHVVRYRVQPPAGDTVVDELRTRIPVAMMQIDRPGREVITDKESIEIAGAVGKDTQIRLDKTTIPVKDGRFLYRLMLPEPGEYKPRLVASAAGKAPLGITLVIKRVRDLNQAAAQFSPVQDLTYAKLAPNPAIYKGQKIALEGRVYAIDPRGSDSVIQMFVRPCPSSRRCPLWVSDPHATDVDVDAWIRVLGVVQGEQQFRSEKNEIVTVPKVESQFVLPAAP